MHRLYIKQHSEIIVYKMYTGVFFYFPRYYVRYFYINPSVFFMMTETVVASRCIDKLMVLMGNSLAEELQDLTTAKYMQQPRSSLLPAFSINSDPRFR